jgi:hypothetical protein
MTAAEFGYFGAKVEINERYDNGDTDAKIFPDKNDIAFIESRFSRESFKETLAQIRDGKLSLKVQRGNNLE